MNGRYFEMRGVFCGEQDPWGLSTCTRVVSGFQSHQKRVPVLLGTGCVQAVMFSDTQGSTLAAHFDSSQRFTFAMSVAAFVFLLEFWVENASGFAAALWSSLDSAA